MSRLQISLANATENLISSGQISTEWSGRKKNLTPSPRSFPEPRHKKETENTWLRVFNIWSLTPSVPARLPGRCPVVMWGCLCLFNYCNSGPPTECLHLPLSEVRDGKILKNQWKNQVKCYAIFIAVRLFLSRYLKYWKDFLFYPQWDYLLCPSAGKHSNLFYLETMLVVRRGHTSHAISCGMFQWNTLQGMNPFAMWKLYKPPATVSATAAFWYRCLATMPLAWSVLNKKINCLHHLMEQRLH